eukprot:COSAG04_NODE_30785_length_260_cov_1.285714_1_plen_45_part_01
MMKQFGLGNAENKHAPLAMLAIARLLFRMACIPRLLTPPSACLRA